MSAISELRKKAEEKFPGYPLDFEDGTSVTLKASVNFTESEREAFNTRIKKIQAYEDDQDATASQLHAELVEALASVSNDAEKTQTELAKESAALLFVILDEYRKHVESQDESDASKSKGTPPASRTRAKRA